MIFVLLTGSTACTKEKEYTCHCTTLHVDSFMNYAFEGDQTVRSKAGGTEACQSLNNTKNLSGGGTETTTCELK